MLGDATVGSGPTFSSSPLSLATPQSQPPPPLSLGAHFAALCGDATHNRIGRPLKAPRAVVAALDELTRNNANAAQSTNEGAAKSVSPLPSSVVATSSTFLYGRCRADLLPVVGSVARPNIIRAAAGAGVATPIYSGGLSLDFGARHAYLGPAGCTVLCEALLTYPCPQSDASADDAADADAVSGGPPTYASIPKHTMRVATYCALKELRLSDCGLDTGAAFALFRLLTHERCAHTLKVLDVRRNPLLALEAGQLFLGALGYVPRGEWDEAGSSEELLALLASMRQCTEDNGHGEDAVDGDTTALFTARGGVPRLVAGAVGEALQHPSLRTFDMGTQTGGVSLEGTLSGAAGGDEAEVGAGADGEPISAEEVVARRRAARAAALRASGFSARPRAPARVVSRLCDLPTEGTNIPFMYVRRIAAMCEQNQML